MRTCPVHAYMTGCRRRLAVRGFSWVSNGLHAKSACKQREVHACRMYGLACRSLILFMLWRQAQRNSFSILTILHRTIRFHAELWTASCFKADDIACPRHYFLHFRNLAADQISLRCTIPHLLVCQPPLQLPIDWQIAASCASVKATRILKDRLEPRCFHLINCWFALGRGLEGQRQHREISRLAVSLGLLTDMTTLIYTNACF